MKVQKPGATALYPAPPVLVSCGRERPNVLTLAWAGTISSNPPSVSISVRPTRFSHKLIVDASEFVVNLPRADQVEIVDYCGHASGREVDKFQACGLTPVPASKVGVPLVAECPISLECKVTHHLNMGVHDLFIGEVVAIQADESVLNERGQLDFQRAGLLAYVGGYYYELGRLLGRHGDWRKAFD